MSKILIIAAIFISQLAAADYVYAPVPRGLKGQRSLACIGISYTNPVNDYVTAGVCKKAATNTADFYSRNSRNLLMLQPAGYHMNYPGEAWASFEKAGLYAKTVFPANYYIIPSLFRKGGNHASQGIAWVIQLTGWVINHEVGHLLGLQHTGAFTYSAKGGVSYQPYGDRDSVMGGGGVGSRYLTAPQYYQKGWLPQKEAAMYVPGTTYELKRISNFKDPGLSVVVIPNALLNKNMPNSGAIRGRPAYVAFPMSCKGQCFALYLGGSGASSKIGASATEFFDKYITGLHVKVVGNTATNVKVMIDFAQPSSTLALSTDEIEMSSVDESGCPDQ